ncbi:MAG: hypothetical protein P8R42_27380 [Candidatus Binatia bacterium]|nr:hypothetical protein [Candidatus Binatia bacterium]
MRDTARRLRPLSSLCAVLLLAQVGCTPAVTGIVYGVSDKGPNEAQKVLLNEELAPYRQRGESAITGRIFLETPNGEVPGASRPVHLTPATSYAKQLAQTEVIEKNEMIDRKAEGVWWTTKAGRDGRFVFSWLPAGDYLVLAEIAWSPEGGTSAQEDVAYALVRVGEREHVEVIVKRTVTD